MHRRKILGAMASLASLHSGCLIADDARPRRSEESERQRLPCWKRLEIDTSETKTFSVADEDEMVLPREEVHSDYERHEDPDYPTWRGYIDTEDYSTVVLLDVKVYNAIGKTNQKYEDVISDFQNPEDRKIGDKAHRDSREEEAEVIFSVSNALGRVKSYVPEQAPDDPDQRRYSPLGQVGWFSTRMHDWWGGTGWFDRREGFCRQL